MTHYPAHSTIFNYAKQNQQKVACIQDNEILTYQQLAVDMQGLANLLQASEKHPSPVSQCIGIFTGKTIHAWTAIQGTLLSGRTYVPIDIKSPSTRIQFIADTCSINTWITTQDQLELLESIFGDQLVNHLIVILNPSSDMVDFDSHKNYLALDSTQTLLSENNHEVAQLYDTDQIATILFTSGSTGNPKGVAISHRAIATFVEWGIDYFQLTSQDKLISHAPLQFDLSLFDIFCSLGSGASCVLIPDSKANSPQYIRNLLSQQKVSIWQSVPSMLSLLLHYGKLDAADLSSLRHVLFAGEQPVSSDIKELGNHFAFAKFHNIYGCTETNNSFIFSFLPSELNSSQIIPIGKPLSYIDYKIVPHSDQTQHEVAEGELQIKSPTLMNGYLLDGGSEITAINGECQDGYYRTKDLVKFDEAGNLIFCGRTDDIVKINGNRISLSDIAHYFKTHPSIEEMAVTLSEDSGLEKKLIAFLFFGSNHPLSTIQLKSFAAQYLPRYAIPNEFHISQSPLPKTTSGKIDKKLLIKQQVNHVYC